MIQSSTHRSWFLVAFFLLANGCNTGVEESSTTDTFQIEELFAITEELTPMVQSTDEHLVYRVNTKGRIDIRGPVVGSVVFGLAATPNTWDLSTHSIFALQFVNKGTDLVVVDARLENSRKQLGPSSLVYLLPDETARICIPLTHAKNQFPAESPFSSLAVKPSGHRQHWLPFDATQVSGVVLEVRTSANEFQLDDLMLGPAYPHSSKLTDEFEALPLIDPFGQLRVPDWTGKLSSQSELKARRDTTLNLTALTDKFNQSGKTFRVQKLDGKWWFIDPNGNRFWSLGVNGAGRGSPVRVWKRRHLYQWLPQRDTGAFKACYSKRNGVGFFDFYTANQIRQFGTNHRKATSAETNSRLATWGFNTLGAPASQLVRNDSAQPFTLIFHTTQRGDQFVANLPNPFDADFASRLNQQAAILAKQQDNLSRCLGVFVDENQHWPYDLVSTVLSQPSSAREAFVEQLRKQYSDLDMLNEAWKTSFADWADVKIPRSCSLVEPTLESGEDSSATHQLDIEIVSEHITPESEDAKTRMSQDAYRLYSLFADRYYSQCREAMDRHFPGYLYLGSRLRKFPPLVGEACARWADVVSINQYSPSAHGGSLADDIDRPILVSRFHVGSTDAGLPGWGNLTTSSQTQRARVAANYLVSALQDERIVGVHWDSFCDQSAAAQPGNGNHVGLVDITGKPYEELTQMLQAVSKKKLSIRESTETDALGELSVLFNQASDPPMN